MTDSAIQWRIPVGLACLLQFVFSPHAALLAQSAAIRVTPLPAVSSTVATEFSTLTSVRELADGRLLAVDAAERKVVVIDWKTGTSRQIGREGGGASEYQGPRTLYALAGDSSLLPDPRNGRWLLLAADSIVGIVSADAPAVRVQGGPPLGADARGFVITTIPRIAGGVPRLDSMLLLRVTRTNGHADTVSTLLARKATIPSGSRIDLTTPIAVSFNPLAVGEQAVIFADGWIAIARLAPYRVDWVDPNGKLVRGAALPFESVRVDAEEKNAVLAREARLTGRPQRAADAVAEWPLIVPAFLQNALLPAPDGTVWVRRATSVAHPETRYDVVDRNGALLRRITTEASTRIVGFGRSSMYTIKADDDGIERLQRHTTMAVRGTRP